MLEPVDLSTGFVLRTHGFVLRSNQLILTWERFGDLGFRPQGFRTWGFRVEVLFSGCRVHENMGSWQVSGGL